MDPRPFLERQWLVIRRQVYPVLILVALMWAGSFADWMLPSHVQLGIRPREISSLPGIAFAPFLHENLSHLLANTVPLLILGWTVSLSGRWLFIWVSLVTAVTSGCGAWLFGASGAHMGASGIVFGLLGFLVARGWVARRIGWTLVSVAVGVFYASNMLSLLMPQSRISWSSHFWGLVGGLGLAWSLYRKHGQKYLTGKGRLGTGSGGTTEIRLPATRTSGKARR